MCGVERRWGGGTVTPYQRDCQGKMYWSKSLLQLDLEGRLRCLIFLLLHEAAASEWLWQILFLLFSLRRFHEANFVLLLGSIFSHHLSHLVPLCWCRHIRHSYVFSPYCLLFLPLPWLTHPSMALHQTILRTILWGLCISNMDKMFWHKEITEMFCLYCQILQQFC